MIARIYLICIVLMVSCLWVGEGFATVTKTYTPAPQISLTGTTSDVRFDVEQVLYDASSIFSGAYLDTGTQNMSGAFYIQDIGWALMSSGAYQVKIQCSQVLENLTSDCEFTGSGWAENIGELSFANVRYKPSMGTLSGSIGSFAGDFAVDGISLPLHPVDLIEPLTGLTANHATTLTVQSGSEYGDGTWTIRIIPLNAALTKTFVGSNVGQFTTDLSFADSYTWEITDPQGSITRFSFVEVRPTLLSQTLDMTSGLFIQDICDIPSPKCPDGTTRSATKLDKIGANKVADGASYYDFTLKPRDKYGNRVNTGSVEISYTGTVSAVQIPENIMSPYLLPNSHDALIFDEVTFLTSYDGRWENILPIELSGQDIKYKIASIAPTDDTTDNIVVLDRVLYTAPDNITTSTFTDLEHIEFDPPYIATVNSPMSILIGSDNRFTGTLNSYVTGPSLNPDLITLLLIGDGLFADFEDLASDLVSTEASPDNSWSINFRTPSSITVPSPTATFGFTGTYAPRTAFPVLENVTLQSFVHYTAIGNMGLQFEVIYPQAMSTKTSEYKASRIKILGQNNARAEYGTISTTSKSRADMFNQIRKTVALLSRGRTSYTDVPYIISTSNQNIGNNYFNDKQTIIVIGKDITITENIDRDTDHPLAIIALAKDGVGGNIVIADGVTDIHASLFAEHAMMTSGDSQLYIGGSLVSGNTLGETAAGICPYYVTGVCDAKLYDLEEMRTFDGMGAGTASTSPTAGQYLATSMIIEYDMRLQTDPPPGLSW